jgi:hypothetical protein
VDQRPELVEGSVGVASSPESGPSLLAEPERPSTRLKILAPNPGRTVVQAWLASRGLILLVALLLAVTEGRDFVRVVAQWDVEHFTTLATGGYLAREDGTLMAFFPGLPMLLRAGTWLGLPVEVTGVGLALVGSALAAAALLRLGGPWAAVAWLFAPTAVFTCVPYTESLFCAAAFWAWERARADRWAAAAVLAAAACTLRVSGLFLVGALVVLALTQSADPSHLRRFGRRVAAEVTGRRLGDWGRRGQRLLWLLLPIAVIGAFVLYLYGLTGSWTAWYTAQAAGWERELTPPWESFWHTWDSALPGTFPERPLWPPVFAAEIVSMAVGVVVVGWCLGRRLWAEASWVGIQVVAFSVSYWFFSVNRAVLLWFPLWMMIGQIVEHRPATAAGRIAHGVVVALGFAGSALVMLAWSWLYFSGNWAS